MSQTIKRKAPSARKTVAAEGKARKVRQAKAQTGSAFDALMAWLPLNEEQLHRLFLASVLALAAGIAWLIASLAGVPALANERIAMIAADSGFAVRRVEVRGVRRLNELKVYERALAQRDQAMPLVDIEGLRQDLLQLSWVKDARVSRQLPDTLVIDIVERSPHALLRKPDRYVLIDETGHELEVTRPESAKGMLVLGGPGAGQQMLALGELLAAAPALKPQVTEAQWVGNRRWNLTFRTGQVLALPEGKQQSAHALVEFARLDGINRLLGGQVAAFDMRAPDRIYLRIPGRGSPPDVTPGAAPSSEAADTAKPAATGAKVADAGTTTKAEAAH